MSGGDTELVQLITTVQKDHHWWFIGNLGVPGMPDRHGYKCNCGWETRDDDGQALADPDEHVAEAIVAAADHLGVQAQRRLAAVRRLHQQYRPAFNHPDVCSHCTRGMILVDWPCPTVQALDNP